jgi:hypothetical protein
MSADHGDQTLLNRQVTLRQKNAFTYSKLPAELALALGRGQ